MHSVAFEAIYLLTVGSFSFLTLLSPVTRSLSSPPDDPKTFLLNQSCKKSHACERYFKDARSPRKRLRKKTDYTVGSIVNTEGSITKGLRALIDLSIHLSVLTLHTRA